MSLEPESLRDRIARRRRVYLVRHGDVRYFDLHGRPYPAHTVPLSEAGRGHAAALRVSLRDTPLDRVVHTGLPRTIETAEAIASGRALRLEVCTELQEIQPGPVPRESAGAGLESHFTGAFRGAVSREARFLGGETFGEHHDRVMAAFEALLAQSDWKHLLLVAHGGTNRVLLLRAMGAGLESMARLEQEPGCLNVIDIHGPAEWLVRQVNYTPYSPLKHNVWETTLEKIFLEHYDGVIRSREGRSE